MSESLSNWVNGQPMTYRAVLQADDRLVMSVAETAKLLGISPDTVRDYTRKGFLFAPDTYGGRVLITKASLEKFLTEGPPRPAAPEPSPEPSVPPPPARRRKKDDFNLDAFKRQLRRRTG